MLSTAANLINKLACEHDLSDAELLTLITSTEPDINKLLACEADKLRRQYYGDKVYIRGLIEFTNYCKNNCYYCGIRAGNSLAERYRLTQEEILACCAEGYSSASAPSCCRVARMRIIRMTKSAPSSAPSASSIPTAPLHCPLAKKAVPAIRHTSMQAPTVICCATKQRMRSITPSCIQTA